MRGAGGLAESFWECWRGFEKRVGMETTVERGERGLRTYSEAEEAQEGDGVRA